MAPSDRVVVSGPQVGTTTRWTGWEPRPGATGEPGLVGPAVPSARYELLALAGRGFRPPRYLTVRAVTDDAAPAPEDAAGAASGLREVWSLEYTTIAQTAPSRAIPYAIYLLGVDPPEGATAAELDAFNAFYTDVHLPEVAERRHALRAVRFELARVRTSPPKGAPRFLATYEVDEAGAAQRRHTGPPYSSGPDVWQRHTTPWRIWFRRLPDVAPV